jgi:hypothetical protein
MVASGYSSNAITRNIAVPNAALINKGLRMRIIMKYGGYASSPCSVNGCGTEWGEVEDYTVFVQNGMNKTGNEDAITETVVEPALQSGIELTSVFPNPITVNQRDINIQYRVLHAGAVRVSVQSIDGKVLSTQEVTATEGENRNAINLPGLAAGVYTVVISNVDGRHLQKFVVQ